MDFFGNLALGFSVAFSPINLIYCIVGVTLGTLIGVLPGVGPVVTISVLLPLTFGLPPEAALIMLAGIYYGASYGGSTTAILVNLPGESSSAITCLDGYQMSRQGRAGPALAVAALGSLVAGCVGTVLIALLGPPLTSMALEFGPSEYFALCVLALCCTAALVQGSILKGLLMALTGVLVGLVGTDVNSGVPRFTFGVPSLIEGVEFVIVATGLFGIAEIVNNLNQPEKREISAQKITGLMPTARDLKQSAMPIMRGTGIGSIIGVLPGLGPTLSTFLAYIVERKVSRHPERFGKGAIEGVAGPEAANNAAAQTSFIPTLTLGIPGSATMALMLGALTMQGITPGPQVMGSHPQLFWGLIASMWIGNVILVALNLPMVGLWVRVLRVPYSWLFPMILALACVGVLSLKNNPVDLWLVALFGALGVAFHRLGCEAAPLILGFILGPMLEENMRRALLMSRGDPMTFVESPISAICLAVAALIVLGTTVSVLRDRRMKIGEATPTTG